MLSIHNKDHYSILFFKIVRLRATGTNLLVKFKVTGNHNKKHLDPNQKEQTLRSTTEIGALST